VQVGETIWQQVEDIPAGEGTCYRLDPVAGEISFGDFDSVRGSGHGLIPPRDSSIEAKTYRYVLGGLSGNVQAGQVNWMRTTVAGITAVTNLSASSGAANEETFADTMRQAPEMLKIRNRAVSAEDYEFLATAATTAVARTRCLAPRLRDDDNAPWMYGGIDRSPGNVNVIIVPDQGLDVPTPEPQTDLIYEVQQYLDGRRDMTAHLLVTGPRYLPIKTDITAFVWSTAVSKEEIKKDLEDKLQQYFHPIRGRQDKRGWQIGQSVYQADLYKALMLDPDLGYISVMAITAGTPLYDPPTRPPDLVKDGSLVQLADYELVCFDPTSKVDVRDQKTPPADLPQESTDGEATTRKRRQAPARSPASQGRQVNDQQG
jgi:predicted phage baseplate assembly protein